MFNPLFAYQLTQTSLDIMLREWLNNAETITPEGIWSVAVLDAFNSIEATGYPTFLKSDEVFLNEDLPIVATLTVWLATVTLDELLTFTDLPQTVLAILAYDYIAFTESMVSKSLATDTVRESLEVLDSPSLIKAFTSVVADAFATTESLKAARGLLLTEYLRAVDSVVHTQIAGLSVSEILALRDEATKGFAALLTETLTFAESALATFALALVIQDALAASETLSRTYVSNPSLASTVAAADTLTSAGTFQVRVLDDLSFDFRLIMDGQTYQCWVLNTEEMLPSIYSGFDFTSFDEKDGVLYGTKNDGVYDLSATTDAGAEIETGVRIDLDRMGSPMEKWLQEAYFGVVGTTPAVRVTTEEGFVTYLIVHHRAETARGHTGKEWSFDLVEVSEVNFIELQPIIFQRS